ncbi:MAG: hypothetical protein V3W31_07915 [Thermodesulfobacteriota bacterium]
MKELAALSVVLLLFLPSCADGQPDERLNCDEVKAREFKTLGFKGLHLGMTVEEVDELVDCTPWRYGSEYLDSGPMVVPPAELAIILEVDGSAGSRAFRTVGCRQEYGEEKCYQFERVLALYIEGKTAGLFVSALNNDKEFTRDWASFMLGELTKKYGEPSELYNRTEDIEPSLFVEDFIQKIAMWKVGEEVIYLQVVFERSGYMVAVVLGAKEAQV